MSSVSLEELVNEPDAPNRLLPNTTDPTPWLGIPLTGVIGSFEWHVGLDLLVGQKSVVLPGGYAQVYGNNGGFKRPVHGIFIPDSDPETNRRLRILARKVTAVALEFYSDDAGSGGSGPQERGAGGARFGVDVFNNFSNGGLYSPPVGIVRLLSPSLDLRVQGWVLENGAKVTRAGAIQVEAFLEEFASSSDALPTILPDGTATGYLPRPFFSVQNNSDGYFGFSPAPPGLWHVYVTNRATGYKYEFTGAERLLALKDHPWEFHLDKPQFGH